MPFAYYDRLSPARKKIYRKSDCQAWNLFAGEAGRCHAITDWVLCAPGKLALWFVGAVSNIALAACSQTVCHSDDLIRLPFSCPPKTRMPCSGRYQVMYCGDKDEELCTGQYELPSYCGSGDYWDMRVPLYRQSKLKACVEKESPIVDVVMRCKRRRKCPDQMRVCSVHMLNHLRPNAAQLLDPKMCAVKVPCRSGVLDYHPGYCTEFESEESRLCASPHQRLKECHDAVGSVLRDNKFRLVGHIGDTLVCNLANDNSSPRWSL